MDYKKTNFFDYRCVMGAWINDIGSIPKIEQWPSIEFDQILERDFITFFDKVKELRYNYVVIFGLFLENWESDFNRRFNTCVFS